MENKRKANIGNGPGTPKNKRFKLGRLVLNFRFETISSYMCFLFKIGQMMMKMK